MSYGGNAHGLPPGGAVVVHQPVQTGIHQPGAPAVPYQNQAPSSTVMNQHSTSWETGFCDLCATGATNFCYTFPLCSSCANATSRNQFDGSNWCFNCVCLTPAAARNIVRRGYNIKGSGTCDCCATFWLPWCSNSQMLGETIKRGKAIYRPPNRQPWEFSLFSCSESSCETLMYGLFCSGCAIASARSKFDGSDCRFNFCCVTTPVLYNIVRKGYHIEGSSCGDILISLCCGPCQACQMLNEVDSRNKRSSQLVNAAPASHNIARI